MAFSYINGKIARDKRNKKIRLNHVAEIWQQHFTLPVNGLPGLEETSYTIDYQGVRIMMIDTNDEEKLNEQAVWMRQLLINNPNKWTIVAFHHPFYSAGRNRDDDETRNSFLEIFDEFHVDLVLTGHDHAYARSEKLVNSHTVNWQEPGTVYVVSVSGPKMYQVNSKYSHLMAKTIGNMQLYQIIKVSQEGIEYTSHNITGDIIDHFILNK